LLKSLKLKYLELNYTEFYFDKIEPSDMAKKFGTDRIRIHNAAPPPHTPQNKSVFLTFDIVEAISDENCLLAEQADEL
jgi:hypothetical protein